MPDTPRHIIIVAGEASGDMHAAHLVRELKLQDPTLTFSGLGGKALESEGVELYSDLTKLAVVGFVEVLKNYHHFKALFDLVLKKIADTRAEAVILVDYPGFNLRLAKALRSYQTRVIYYISPQVWAWKESRVQTIREYVDQMIVLFPFEKDFYARHGINVCYAGHPLVDTVSVDKSRDEVLQDLGLRTEGCRTIGLLPGSRQNEVKALLPVMLGAAAKLHGQRPDLQFMLIQAATIKPELISSALRNVSTPVHVKTTAPYDGIHACDFCLVASGTATLETAILGKPMVVLYKTHLLTWLLAKLFVKIPDIALVNVVAQQRIVPECVQFQANVQTVTRELLPLINNPSRTHAMTTALKEVRAALGQQGAIRRAATAVLKGIEAQNEDIDHPNNLRT